MKVVVTGATGMIGGALVRALVERGDEVTALSRSPDDAAREARRGRRRLEGPALRAGPGRGAARPRRGGAPGGRAGRAALVRRRQARHPRLAGARHAQPRGRRWRRSRRPSARRRSCPSPPAGWYGARGDERLDESAPAARRLPRPGHRRPGRRRRARAEELGVRVVTTRTGVVLAESGGALEKMLPPFKLGVGGPVAGGRQYVPWVHLDDVVGAILFCLDTPGGRRPGERDRPGAGDQPRALARARPGAPPAGAWRPCRAWR